MFLTKFFQSLESSRPKPKQAAAPDIMVIGGERCEADGDQESQGAPVRFQHPRPRIRLSKIFGHLRGRGD